MSNTQYDFDKLFLAYEEARADRTAHFRKIIELQKELSAKDAEIESLKSELKDTKNELSCLKRAIINDEVESCSQCLEFASELAEKDAVLEFCSLGETQFDGVEAMHKAREVMAKFKKGE